MHVLQVHHHYASNQPSGENITVGLIAVGLEALGHRVTRFWPSSDDLVGHRTLLHALGPVGLGPLMVTLSGTLRRDRPDVVLLHNVNPTLGPAAVAMARSHGLPVVRVVHNYRQSCIAGTHWRDGAPCFDCVGTAGRTPGIRNRCYRGSAVQSSVITAGELVHGRNWSRVTSEVHLSAWMRDQTARLSDGPEPAGRIIHDPVAAAPRLRGGRGEAVYVGRLTQEKGVLLLLNAWERARHGRLLHIVGSGPLTPKVRELAARGDSRVVFHGSLTPGDVAELRTRVAVACVPALWDEPFGRVAAEAQAAGQIVIATPRGALPEIVVPGTGLLVDPDPGQWAGAIDQLIVGDHADMSDRALSNWQQRFSPERACADYSAALTAAAQGRGPTDDGRRTGEDLDVPRGAGAEKRII
jgi:glycosyltransferase involved in cell wall biosynthesis